MITDAWPEPGAVLEIDRLELRYRTDAPLDRSVRELDAELADAWERAETTAGQRYRHGHLCIRRLVLPPVVLERSALQRPGWAEAVTAAMIERIDDGLDAALLAGEAVFYPTVAAAASEMVIDAIVGGPSTRAWAWAQLGLVASTDARQLEDYGADGQALRVADPVPDTAAIGLVRRLLTDRPALAAGLRHAVEHALAQRGGTDADVERWLSDLGFPMRDRTQRSRARRPEHLRTALIRPVTPGHTPEQDDRDRRPDEAAAPADGRTGSAEPSDGWPSPERGDPPIPPADRSSRPGSRPTEPDPERGPLDPRGEPAARTGLRRAGAAPGADDAPTPGESDEAVVRPAAPTRLGGVLYLLHVIGELDLPLENVLVELAALVGVDPSTDGFFRLDALEPLWGPDDSRPADGPSGRTTPTTLADLLDRVRLRLGDRETASWGDARLATHVCRRSAGIQADPGWIDVTFALDDVSVDLRAAGLDLDPGLVPWLGCVVRFHYE